MRLLRFLQEREFERVGGTRPIPVDVRIIAATSRDLDRAVKEGLFREDLYYRLNVVPITIPPFRERREDILPLARHFMRRFSLETKKSFTDIDQEAQRRLLEHNWPGNVRQLKNVIESAVVLANKEILDTTDLPEEIKHPENTAVTVKNIDYNLSFRDAKKILIENFERDFIKRKLEEFSGNISRTAEALDMHRQNLQQKIRDLRITK